MKPLPSTTPIGAQSDVPEGATRNQAQRRQIQSHDLFSGGREVLIEHAGELYSLRQTSKGKLILTK